MTQLPLDIAQSELKSRFVETNNAGRVGRTYDLTTLPHPAYRQIDYKGPLASDREQPHDIQLRVHGNTGSHRKEPVAAFAQRWMLQHPEMYRAFVEATFNRIGRGFKHYSAKAIIEYVRWHTDTPGGKPFKIANAVTTYMARRFMEEHPAHAGFFRTTTKRK